MCDPRLINLADAIYLDDDIERLIEQNAAHIPWSADSALGVKTRKALDKTMLKYLRALYKAFPMAKMTAALRHLGVPEEATTEAAEEWAAFQHKMMERTLIFKEGELLAPPEARDITEDWLLAAETIRAVVLAELAEDFNNAAAQAALAALNEWAKDKGIEFTGLWGEGNMASLADSTLDWAREHGGELITQIDDATRATINQIVASGLENQDGTRGIQKALEHFIDDDQMTKARAEMIARTEANNAVSRGAYEANAAVGAREKEWLYYGGVCPSGVCPDNEGDGRIPIDDSFSSGHSYPTAHPRCQCVVVYFGVDIDKLRGLGE